MCATAQNLISPPNIVALKSVFATRAVTSDEGDRLDLAGWELSDGERLKVREGTAILGKRSERRCMLKPAGARWAVNDLSSVGYEAHNSNAPRLETNAK